MEEDLLPDQEAQDQNGADDLNLHLQVGVVHICPATVSDPVFESYVHHDALVPFVAKQNADGVRLWAKLFSPLRTQGSATISARWANFFTVMLLTPSHFEWAKSVS